MPARRPTSARKSKPRYGMCAEDEAPDTARHLSIMNKNAQMELIAYGDKHNLPYYDKIEFDENGWLVSPPSDHRLSDALVFLITGQNLVVARNRHGKWPSDFNSDGDVYPDRWPQGDPVVIWAHGIPFVPVFSDYYALVGSHRRKYLWLVSKKVSHAKIAHPGWHIGEIVISPKKLQPASDSTFIVDFETHDWSKFTPVPTLNCATTRLLLAFQGTTLLLTPPTNIRGFHPAVGPAKTSLANRPTSFDEQAWTSMAEAPYNNITSFSLRDRGNTCVVLTTTHRHPQDPDPHGVPQPSTQHTPAPAADPAHPAAHGHINTRDEPSRSPSPHISVPPQEQSTASEAGSDGQHTRHVQPKQTTTDNIRHLLGSFNTTLLEDCDHIDDIANKIAEIAQKHDVLDHPEAQRILRLNNEVLQDHQTYQAMKTDIRRRLTQRDDWQQRMLQTAFDDATKGYDERYGDDDDQSDVSMTEGSAQHDQPSAVHAEQMPTI